MLKDTLQLREEMSVLPLAAMVSIFGLWVRQFTFLVKQTSFVEIFKIHFILIQLLPYQNDSNP